MSTSEEDRKRAVIDEIEKFLGMASEQPVIELLSTALKKFRSEPVELAQPPPPEVIYKVANREKYENWTDLPQRVEITLWFDKMTKDDVEFDVTNTSMEIRARNVQGEHPGTKLNLRYTIPKLFKQIDKDQSYFELKTDHVLVTLHKAVMESWSSLREVGARQKRARIEN